MAETAYYSALTCINAPKDQGYLDFISNICIYDIGMRKMQRSGTRVTSNAGAGERNRCTAVPTCIPSPTFVEKLPHSFPPPPPPPGKDVMELVTDAAFAVAIDDAAV